MMLQTIDAGDLVGFVTVVQEGSFTRAAARLGTGKAQISRVVARLEARLGARLLQRTTRSLSLTEIGTEVFARGTTILEAMDETVQRVRHVQEAPQGTLRVSSGVEFGLLVVQRWISTYLAAYGDVSVEVSYSHRLVDLVHERFDVAIRVGELSDSGLSARRLGEVRYGLFAAPAYLDRRAPPQAIASLAAHDLVLSTQTRGARGRWQLTRGADSVVLALRPRLLVDSHMAVRDAAAEGLGIGLFPRFMGRPLVARGVLRPVLPDWERARVPVHAVFPSSRYLAPSVRAFVDTCVEGFDATFEGDANAESDLR